MDARLLARFLATFAILGGATLGASFATDSAFAQACPGPASDEELTARIRDADLVVLGDVIDAVSEPGVDRDTLRLRPIAFFKGNPSAALINVQVRLPGPCLNPSVYFGPGARLLLIAQSVGGTVVFPEPERVYSIDKVLGVSLALNRGDTVIVQDVELFTRIRTITGQMSVAAESKEEGAGIEWWKTIVPVLVALAFIGGAGFFLMRIWHRIDPS